jgi:hypothetical protein
VNGAETYEDAVVSMNAHFQCDLPANDRLAARDFGARKFPPSASAAPAKALRVFHEAVGEGLPSGAPVVEANGVFEK